MNNTDQANCVEGPELTHDADDLFRAELRHINQGRASEAASLEDCSALAFSGGGIRSASFGMGLMQSLVARDKLQYMDYLSSVSGGSYLSASLTWYLSQKGANGEARFNCRDNFPFGEKNLGDKENRTSTRVNILNYLRLHGSYLAPGNGLGMLAFIATMLRVIVGSLLIYFALLTLAFVAAQALVAGLEALRLAVPQLYLLVPGALTFSSVFIALFALAVLAYFVVSVSFSVSTFRGVGGYDHDITTQVWLGRFLRWALAFLLFGLLPLLHEQMIALVQIFAPDPDADVGVHGTVAASSSTIGALLGVLAHLRAMRGSEGVSTLQINLAAFFLLFGMLFGAYVFAVYWPHGTVSTLVIAAIVGFLAIYCNVNLFGLNRMYRNRLMETFMQAPDKVNQGIWAAATEANKTYVSDMCTYPNNRPYHLINCNIVLVDSDNAHFRGRKGDCFVFSPLYTGSDATGWRRTADYSSKRAMTDDKGMTLPTAMAISGAAANPYGGMAGQGPTTDKLVSLVMSVLSLRLGFWAENPRNEPLRLRPNYIWPGLQGTALFGPGLTEERNYVELSDGGHFENLGIYELLRRGVKLIIVSDAGQDETYTFSDLANAVEKARVDFGIRVDFDNEYSLPEIMPGILPDQSPITSKNTPLARRGFALARIQYPPSPEGGTGSEGCLVYVKPTLIPELGVDVLSYRRQSPTFPHESTIDQFFDEVQFEAYRELGYRIGMAMLATLEKAAPDGNATLWNVRKLLRF